MSAAPPPPLPTEDETPPLPAEPAAANSSVGAITIQPPLPDEDEDAPPPPPIEAMSPVAASALSAPLGSGPAPTPIKTAPPAPGSGSPPPPPPQSDTKLDAAASPPFLDSSSDEENVMSGFTDLLTSVVVDSETEQMWSAIELADSKAVSSQHSPTHHKANDATAAAAASFHKLNDSMNRDQLIAIINEQHRQLNHSVKYFRHAAYVHRKTAAQLALARALSNNPRPYVASARTAEITRYYLSCSRAALYFVDAAHSDKSRSVWGVVPDDPRNFDEFRCWFGALGSGVPGKVAATGRALLITDCATNSAHDPSIDEKTHSSPSRVRPKTVLAPLSRFPRLIPPCVVWIFSDDDLGAGERYRPNRSRCARGKQ